MWVLSAKYTWEDKNAYTRTALRLAGYFAENFKQYQDKVSEEVLAAAPKTLEIQLKQSEKLGVNFVNNDAKVFFIFSKLVRISVYDQQWSFCITSDPLIIKIIQFFQVIKPDIFFVFPSSFLNLCDQCRHRGIQVN